MNIGEVVVVADIVPEEIPYEGEEIAEEQPVTEQETEPLETADV